MKSSRPKSRSCQNKPICFGSIIPLTLPCNLSQSVEPGRLYIRAESTRTIAQWGSSMETLLHGSGLAGTMLTCNRSSGVANLVNLGYLPRLTEWTDRIFRQGCCQPDSVTRLYRIGYTKGAYMRAGECSLTRARSYWFGIKLFGKIAPGQRCV